MNEKFVVSESSPSTNETHQTRADDTRRKSLGEQASIMARVAREKLEELENINAEQELVNRRNTSGQ